MLQQIKDFFTPNFILEERKKEEFIREQELERQKQEEELRQRCYEWAKKHIKRWGVRRYRYVFIVRNSERDYDDDSTRYRAVYSSNNMGLVDDALCCFHISELFPWKPDAEYYKDDIQG